MLPDTGIIVATLSADDAYHHKANKLIENLVAPFITTLPCLTEALYLLGERGGSYAQGKLHEQIREGMDSVPPFTLRHVLRACELMQKYADAPMDFADASLVVMAEELGITKILTIDGHFYAYRINGTTPFQVLPI